jgi:hypothetical protein
VSKHKMEMWQRVGSGSAGEKGGRRYGWSGDNRSDGEIFHRPL